MLSHPYNIVHYLAKTESGILMLFVNPPLRVKTKFGKDTWVDSESFSTGLIVSDQDYPGVTFANSPKTLNTTYTMLQEDPVGTLSIDF